MYAKLYLVQTAAARSERSAQNFVVGNRHLLPPLPSSLPSSHLPLPRLVSSRLSLLHLESISSAKSLKKKGLTFFFCDLCPASSTPIRCLRVYPVWTLEALQLLRGLTPRFWIIGKLTAPSLSLRGNIWATTSLLSGIPARNPASAPMLPI